MEELNESIEEQMIENERSLIEPVQLASGGQRAALRRAAHDRSKQSKIHQFAPDWATSAAVDVEADLIAQNVQDESIRNAQIAKSRLSSKKTFFMYQFVQCMTVLGFVNLSEDQIPKNFLNVASSCSKELNTVRLIGCWSITLNKTVNI